MRLIALIDAMQPETTDLVNVFVDALNGQSESPESHVVCVPTGVVFPEALLSSSVCRSGDTGPPAGAMAHAQAGVAAAAGGGGPNEFGFDPTEDPELAMVGYNLAKVENNSHRLGASRWRSNGSAMTRRARPSRWRRPWRPTSTFPTRR